MSRRTSRAVHTAPLAALAAAIAMLAPLAATAAGTWYVDNQNPAASDANPGTQALPYRSISGAAAAHHTPGTVIYVNPGVYRETVTVPASGDSVAPFAFRAVGQGVVVEGSDDFSGAAKWTLASGTVYLAAGVSWSPLQVFVDGERLTPSAAGPAALPPGSFQYVAGAGLYVNLGGDNPGDHQTTVGRRLYGFRLSNVSWVDLDGFVVAATEDKAVSLSAATHCAVRNCSVTLSRKYGLHLTSGASNLIEKNRVFDNQFHGIGLVDESDDTVQDNESFRNADPAVRVANGLFMSGATTNLIRRNRFHDNQDSGEQLGAASDDNVCIQNLSWNNGDRGFDHMGSSNVVVIGCVAYGNTNDGFTFDAGSTNAQIYDCIGVDNGITTGRADLWLPAAAGSQSDFNLFWNSTAQSPFKYGTTSYATVAAFAAASGTDAHTAQANPKFAAPAAADFHLLAGSPAIDCAHAGLAAWPALDADGNPRRDDFATPNTGIGAIAYGDRGAFEYQPVPQPPIAAFSVTPATGVAPLAVTADASASTDVDGTIVSYRFDFGDGTVVGPQAGPTALHTFATGSWTVSLTVTDNDGFTATTTHTVSVQTNLPPDGTIVRPAADVTIAAGQSVDFAGSGVDPDGQVPLAFAWSFGGGAPAANVAEPGPVLFDTPGTYAVALTVTDARGLADPTPATRVITVTPAPIGAPNDEVHWTFTGPNSVTFDWRGFDRTVRYGFTPSYGSMATAATPSPLPFSSPGPFHEAQITGLAENATYHYSIGGGADHTFHTPPRRGASGFTIFAAGDIGASNQFATIPPMQATIASDHPAFVLMIGDLTYGNTTGQASVDQHFNDMMVWSQDAAYMPSWGNHEWDSSTDDLRNYRGRFDVPHPHTAPGSPGPGGEDWNWFDYGNVRFINYPEPYNSASWPDWKAQAVALMDEAQADPAIRFIVTFGHRPAYSSGEHGDDGIGVYLDALADAHSKYVLNLNGHSHDYERSYPQHGVVHITCGTGGSNLEMQSGSCVWRGGCPAPAWSAFRAMHHVTLRLRFSAGGIVGEALCGPSAPVNDVACDPGTVLDRFVIGDPDLPPVVTAPASTTVDEGGSLVMNVTAADPEGSAITSLAASGLPPGASFSAAPGNASGTLRWSPSFTQAGNWKVTFTATNSRTGSTTTAITVRDATGPLVVPGAPIVSAPASAHGFPGSPLTIDVTVRDPDGDPIQSLVASGLPPGASFLAGSDRQTGRLTWTPAATQAGTYDVIFSAANALVGSATTRIRVGFDRPPVVVAPIATIVQAGETVVVTVSASDPDGDPITALTATNLPGALFTVGTGGTSGRLTWTPAATDQGIRTVKFTATNVLSGTATTTIPLTAPNRAPVPALSVTPATGRVPLVVTADASASTDPDGSVASYTFDFGDGSTSGPQPRPVATHTYAAGNWTLSVRVEDNQHAVAVKSVPVTVGPAPGSFNLVGNPSFETGTTHWAATSGSTAQRVAGGYDGSWALQIKGPASLAKFGCHDSPDWVNSVPVAGARYRYAAWVRSTASTGTAMIEVREYAGTTKLGDVSSQGVVLTPEWQLLTMDYTAAGAGSTLDLQVLDDPVAAGETFVTDDISIVLLSAGGLVGVEPGGGGARVPLVATVAPSPMRSASTISFTTSRPGPLRVTLYDLQGRRVRTVLDETSASAGLHVAAVDGKDERGRRLGSGLYFFRIQAAEGASSGRIVIAR